MCVRSNRWMRLMIVPGVWMLIAATGLAAEDKKPADDRPLLPVGARRAAPGQAEAIEAANRLFATPWARLSDQYEKDTAENLPKSLEGKRIAHGSGKVKELGLEWKVELRIEDVKASIDFSSPPAFRQASSKGFTVDLPKDGWAVAVSGKIKGEVWVKEAGEKVFSWTPSVPFGLRVKDIRISTRVELDDTNPARPMLKQASVTPHLKIGGEGAIPVSVPVSFESVFEDGKLSFRSKVADLGLDLGPLNAGFTGNLAITILPLTTSMDVEIGDVVDLHMQEQLLEVAVRGKLKVKLDKVGKVDVPLSITAQLAAPTSREISQAIALMHMQRPVPRSWGENQAGGKVAAPAAGLDLATPAAQVEAAIVAHLPHGTILSIQQAAGVKLHTWAGEEDSAIWTGHYLAAEAFRWAANKSPEALERVKATLTGMERLFQVASDAVVERSKNGTVRRTAVTNGAGIFARVALPAAGPIQPADGPLSQRPVYYEFAEGGWEVAGAPGTAARRYARYADIPAQDGLPTAKVTIRPLGAVWHGWGVGANHPVSRDQYVGVFMGLAFAWALVDDDDVRSRCGRLLEDALDFLLRNGWNVPLPPDNRIRTTFLGNFEKQLAFLRIGATVNPAKYAQRYKDVAAAAGLTWVPVWLSAHDPLFQYYKFNLVHAAITPALFFEQDPALRAGYLEGYDVLWRTVGHHRNAWFDVAHLLVLRPDERMAAAARPCGSNVAVSLAGEIRATLGEWLERLRLVPGPNGLPLGKVADPAYQIGLWPNGVARFAGLDGSNRYVARFALPVKARNGQGMDFAWQRQPFAVGLDEARDPSQPPTQQEIEKNGAPGRHPRREAPGVDYVLPYWAATYLGILDEAAVVATTGLQDKTGPVATRTPDGHNAGAQPDSQAQLEQLFKAMEQHVAELEARAKELEGRLAQVKGLPNTGAGAGATQPPGVKGVKQPTFDPLESCCAVVANPQLKGRLGRIVVAFPQGARVGTAKVEVYKPDQDNAISKAFGQIKADLLPGSYEVMVNGKRVKGVGVQSGHDTVVHVGVLRAKTGATTRVNVREVGGKKVIATGFGAVDIGLPIGAYEVVVNNQVDKVVIEADKITDF